jgi:SAM-dependent methyltransferase
MMAEGQNSPQAWVSDLQFERAGMFRRLIKAGLVNPLANYFPASVQKLALRILGSELAAASWADPGGWRSMAISYQERRKRLADRLLCTLGTIPMALRNRRLLAARVLARLIDSSEGDPVHVLCLGAGAGHVISDALRESRRQARATLVDLSTEAFDYGRHLAGEKGTGDRTRFVQGDVCEVAGMLDPPPDIVKMLGICEYLTDEQVTHIARCVGRVMQQGSTIVFSSLSEAHGTDRFFRRVFGLRMIHRSPAQLQALMGTAGFADFTALAEPLGVYHVIIGRKAST